MHNFFELDARLCWAFSQRPCVEVFSWIVLKFENNLLHILSWMLACLNSDLSLFNFILQEIYSIKLPGNPKLGEGKPENQNHAIIFTRGSAVQTIDMNQVINCF